MADNKNSLGMDQKTASWFAYIVSIISAIILLVTEKNDKTVRLHAWQSLFLGIAYIIFIVIIYILMAVTFWNVHGLWIFFSIISYLAWVGFIVLSVICIIKATQNSIFKIPIIFGLAEKQK